MNKKDTIIDTYTVPKHSDDLADRIIIAARKIDQKQTWNTRLNRFIFGDGSPALSYRFASILMVGLIMGGVLYNTIETPIAPPSSSDYTYDDLFDDGSNDLLVL